MFTLSLSLIQLQQTICNPSLIEIQYFLDLMYDMYYEFWIWVGLTMAPDGSMMWADGTQYDKESDWRIWHEPLSQAVPERALLCFMVCNSKNLSGISQTTFFL